MTSPQRITWIAAALAALRVVTAAAAELVVFYWLPLNPDRHLSPWVLGVLVIGALFAIVGLQVLAITRSSVPAIRAVEALAATVPLLLLVFAGAYYMMSSATAGSFTQPLDRLDAIYFTTTVFATVGFGDITPVTEAARIVVTVQMLLDLVFLAAGLKIIVGAVKVGRARRADGEVKDANPRPADRAV